MTIQAPLRHRHSRVRKIYWRLYGNAVTISGRLRGHVGFSQAASTPFQSLAADGAKLALFRLLRAGYQLRGFIHDEALVLIAQGSDYTAAVGQIEQIPCIQVLRDTLSLQVCNERLLAYEVPVKNVNEIAIRLVDRFGFDRGDIGQRFENVALGSVLAEREDGDEEEAGIHDVSLSLQRHDCDEVRTDGSPLFRNSAPTRIRTACNAPSPACSAECPRRCERTPQRRQKGR